MPLTEHTSLGPILLLRERQYDLCSVLPLPPSLLDVRRSKIDSEPEFNVIWICGTYFTHDYAFSIEQHFLNQRRSNGMRAFQRNSTLLDNVTWA